MARFNGSTEKCFADFIGKYPHVEMLKHIAAFCDVTVGSVQRWQFGENMPVGEALLRLRCLLSIAGYEVYELNKLNGSVRSMALMIATRLKTPEQIERRLDFKGEGKRNRLWNMLVAGKGIMTSTQTIIDNDARRHRRLLGEALEKQRQQLEEVIAAFHSPIAPQPDAEPTVAKVDPALISALARSIAATSSVAHALLVQSYTADDILFATNGGHDIHELIGLLNKLLGQQE